MLMAREMSLVTKFVKMNEGPHKSSHKPGARALRITNSLFVVLLGNSISPFTAQTSYSEANLRPQEQHPRGRLHMPKPTRKGAKKRTKNTTATKKPITKAAVAFGGTGWHT